MLLLRVLLLRLRKLLLRLRKLLRLRLLLRLPNRLLLVLLPLPLRCPVKFWKLKLKLATLLNPARFC